jgi:hypothetical protein
LEELDNEGFDVRAAAEMALAALGDEIEGDLLADAAEKLALEPRTRLARLVKRVEGGTPEGCGVRGRSRCWSGSAPRRRCAC